MDQGVRGMMLEGLDVGTHTDPHGLDCIDVNDVYVSGIAACLPFLLMRPILEQFFTLLHTVHLVYTCDVILIERVIFELIHTELV